MWSQKPPKVTPAKGTVAVLNLSPLEPKRSSKLLNVWISQGWEIQFSSGTSTLTTYTMVYRGH